MIFLLVLVSHISCVLGGWGFEYETTILVQGKNYKKGDVLFRSKYFQGSNSREGGWAVRLLFHAFDEIERLDTNFQPSNVYVYS